MPLIAGIPSATGSGGRRVAAFAGIGNPQGFLHTVQSLGMRVAMACWFDDHHPYSVPGDFHGLLKSTAARSLDAWVTTFKDWVKLQNTPVGGAPPIWHVRIEARLSPHETELLRARLGTLR